MTSEQARRALLKPDPLGQPRNPLAVYLLCLSLLSGLMILLGVSTSRGMHEPLHPLVEMLWGASLVHGAGSTLTGMYWPGSVPAGLLLKRMGMFALMVASTLYSGVVIYSMGGLTGLLPGGIVLGFGVACGVQYRVINRRIQAIIALSKAQASEGA